jgi:putative membrane protein
MILYDRSRWFSAVFSWRGTALRRAKWRVLSMTLYAIVVQLAYEVGASLTGVELKHLLRLEPSQHAVLGAQLGFLIVFRMNASNNRFWEGRTAWGQIINACRNVVRVGVTYTDRGAELADLVSGYVECLRHSLQGNTDMADIEVYLPEELTRQAMRYGNPPTCVALAISAWIERAYRDGQLDPQLVRQMEDQMAALANAQGACERILKTPLPFAYVVMIKQLIMVYLLSLPFAVGAISGWWSPILMTIIALSLFGIEEASVEIEDPFSKDENCLDMETFTMRVARDAGQMAATRSAIMAIGRGQEDASRQSSGAEALSDSQARKPSPVPGPDPVPPRPTGPRREASGDLP